MNEGGNRDGGDGDLFVSGCSLANQNSFQTTSRLCFLHCVFMPQGQ